MPLQLIPILDAAPVFLLVVSRLAGVLMFMPMLGALSVPANVRALLAIGMATLVTATLDRPAGLPPSDWALIPAMASELLFGVLIGQVVRICFVSVQMAGQMIAQESGLALGQIADPMAEEQESVLGVFYVQLAAAVFLIVGGHRAMIGGVMDSFSQAPLLAVSAPPSEGMTLLLDALTAGLTLTLRVAAPVVLTLFLVNVVLGFLGRAVPQLNAVVLGFTLKGMLVFGLMVVSLPAAVHAFTELLEQAVRWTEQVWTPA